MAPEEIATTLKAEFADAVTEVDVGGCHPHVTVTAEAWPKIARFLRDDPRMAFNWLRCISSVDLLEDNQLAAVYDLHAAMPPKDAHGLWMERNQFAIKVKAPRDKPHIPSVAGLWPAADWHEREAFDLMGIVFDGHPDSVETEQGVVPRRILCADDWEGHPLRKDYEFPMEYHGIPCVTQYGQVRPTY